MGALNSRPEPFYNFDKKPDNREDFVCILGMGDCGSKSSTTQTITNNIVNKNYMDTLNETVLSSAVNTLIQNANSCSSSVNASNSCNINNIKVAGDFVSDGAQTNDVKTDFSCVTASTAEAAMATAMIASMAAEMKALNGSEAAAQLNSAAAATSKTGFISTPQASSSNTNVNIKNDITNETIDVVKNIFQQNLTSNFTTETVNECIGKTIVSNDKTVSNLDIGGNAKIGCVQTNSVEQVQHCKFMSDAVSKTTQETFQELGMKTDVQNTTGISNESTATAKSETIASGPIEEIGNALGGLFGLASLAFLGPILGPICLIFSLLLLILCLFYTIKSFMGSSDSSMSSFNPIANTGIQMKNFASPGNTNMSGVADMAGGKFLFNTFDLSSSIREY